MAALTAHAEIYLTGDQAVAILFPGVEMKSGTVESPVDARKLKRWVDTLGNTVYVDQVIGKHELISFAVGIDKAGVIKGIEILEYREAYGGQIKNRQWRSQFVGKTSASPIKIDRDISNISGATLSSTHVTEAVRRIVTMHEQLVRPHAR